MEDATSELHSARQGATRRLRAGHRVVSMG
jgi:hypothetical protein